MPASRTYNISEVAALTGLHRNTIRTKIRTGQLPADTQVGKFGEEYRISHEALLQTGLLPHPQPEVLTAEPDLDGLPQDSGTTLPGPSIPAEGNALAATVAALADLYQRHEQAMFRLGYLQGELDRAKALAESAESLRRDHDAQLQELNSVRSALAVKEREAVEAERTRRELDEARRRLQEMERLREDLDHLKSLAEQQDQTIDRLEAAARRPFWQFWRRT
jgi:excisionase family DNA binding protein